MTTSFSSFPIPSTIPFSTSVSYESRPKVVTSVPVSSSFYSDPLRHPQDPSWDCECDEEDQDEDMEQVPGPEDKVFEPFTEINSLAQGLGGYVAVERVGKVSHPLKSLWFGSKG